MAAGGKGKPRGRPFPPGNNANPIGAAAHDPVLRAVRRMSRAEVAEMGTALLDMTRADFEKLAKDKDAPMLKVMLAGQALNASKGNSSSFDKLLDRVIGKTKDRIEVSGAVGTKTKYDTLSTEQLAELAAKTASEIKKLTGGK